MDDSILATIKKMLGLDSDYTAFDTDIIVFLNSAMMTLQQLGVGPAKGFVVSDFSQTWHDFLPSDNMLEGVKTYLFLCVKTAFDPPGTSFLLDAMSKQKEELEWRLREQVEFYSGEDSEEGKHKPKKQVVIEMDESDESMNLVEENRRGSPASQGSTEFISHEELPPKRPPRKKPPRDVPRDPFADGPAQPPITGPGTLESLASGTVVGESLVLGLGFGGRR